MCDVKCEDKNKQQWNNYCSTKLYSILVIKITQDISKAQVRYNWSFPLIE